MAKVILTDVANILGNPTSAQTTINQNSDRIEAALENTLSRDGTTPNQMNSDLDMNQNDILNVQKLYVTTLNLDGNNVVPAETQLVILDEVIELRDETQDLRDQTQELYDDISEIVADGEIITPQKYGAIGDGVADDTIPWNTFQSSFGLQYIPRGEYKVGADIYRFDNGAIGNGNFNDSLAAWDQTLGDKERRSLIVHGRTLNVNNELVSPAIKTQTITNWESNIPSGAFKHILGSYHEATLNGFYNTQTDQNNNFTVGGFTVRNKMAGLFGSLGMLSYCWDVSEAENPNILPVSEGGMGATKNGCAYFQPTRLAPYRAGGYMFGCEVIVLNTSSDSATPIPYAKSDEFNYESWTAAHKMSVQTNNCPVSTIILMTGSTTARHGAYVGLTIGASLWSINNDRQGPAGTVGVDMSSWRSAVGFADIGIKFRTANRHLYAREGLKIHSTHTRFMFPTSSCGISIEGLGAVGLDPAATQYLNFRDGATTDADGGSVANRGQLLVSPSQFNIVSNAGEILLSPVNVARFRANSARFAPVTDNAYDLGSGSDRWKVIYAATATINTSDETAKRFIDQIPDYVLDAWGEVDFYQYKLKEAVEEKGSAARTHTGLVAQRVKRVFEDHGIDPFEYGLLCYDSWSETPEEIIETKVEVKPAVYSQKEIKPASYRIEPDENGNLVEIMTEPPQLEDDELLEEAVYETTRMVIPAREAGQLFGIRYEEALALEAAYNRRRSDRIEERLARLEAK